MEEDAFFDLNTRNLIVLDDLMSTVSNDPRINGLFTEGSHHRNLSLISVNQNMYYNKDPTQRRNCHYLVLFNSPIDRQQVMTLARQMYPGKAEYFMHYFEEAVNRPYGYLLVDLKPTTPGSLRLRTNALEDVNSFKENCNSTENRANCSEEPMDDQSDVKQSLPSGLIYNKAIPVSTFTCNDCGLIFENFRDLQRHVKN